MTTFDEREKAHEQKFAHDVEIEFKILSRAYKLLGLWAASQLQLKEQDALNYALQILHMHFDKHDDKKIVQMVLADLKSKGLSFTIEQIFAELDRLQPIAKQQILTE